MSRLYTFGCSLTEQDSWKEKLSTLLNYENVNFGVSGGSNGLQINHFLEHIIHNDINQDDIIVWQVTYTIRNALRLGPKSLLAEQAKKIQESMFVPLSSHYDENNKNIFDQLPRYDLLTRSPLLKEKDILLNFDENDQLQKLLSTLIMISKFHKRLLVFFGDDKSVKQPNKKIFEDYLQKHNIPYLQESYITWAKNSLLGFLDPFHPNKEAGQIYAEKVLYQKFINLGWITT